MPRMTSDEKREAIACSIEPVDGFLALDNLKLKRIPPCIARHGNVVSMLRLGNNQIERIENLDTFTGLKELYLHDNRIEKIEGLDALVNLEMLSLSSNQIHAIEGVDALKKLKWLDLDDNWIARIENVGELEDLSLLKLTRNPELPDGACKAFERERKTRGVAPVACMQ